MMMMIKFLLLSLMVISPISICADKRLMIRECSNAQVPAICMKCLESDPKSGGANPIGIAGIVIHCLDSNLHSLNNTITHLSTKKKDDAIKTALEDCKKDLSEAIAEVLEAQKGLKTRDYDKTGHSIYIALSGPMRCKDNLLKATKGKSPLLDRKFDEYALLCEAAMRIIDRF